jgi:hypothetical protein
MIQVKVNRRQFFNNGLPITTIIIAIEADAGDITVVLEEEL